MGIFIPANTFNITIIDFLVILVVELSFFNFSMNKFKFRDSMGTLTISVLVKVGFLSLFISWLPFSYYYYYNTTNTVAIFTIILLLSGVIISTIMFQKELLLPKNEAFNMAFQLSVLSSSAFYMEKVLLFPNYILYQGPMVANLSDKVSSGLSMNMLNNFLSVGSNGLLFLILGLALFFYFNKNKTKDSKYMNEKIA